VADTPSSILLLRLQSTGSNTNLWGGYLNTMFQTQERADKGYQAYTVTGDATISQTNYSATNDYAVGYVKENGSPTATWTHTLPARQNIFGVWNNSGFAGTLKASGGTGVTVPTARRSSIYGDGVDYYEASSNWLSSYASPLSNNGDIVVKATLESAIAAASGLTAPFILVSAADTTAGYLGVKVDVTGSGAASVSASITNPGANEVKTFSVSVAALGLSSAAEQTAGFSAVSGSIYPVNIAVSGTITFPASASNGDTIGITNYGAGVVTFNWNGLKYNGSTTNLATNSKGLAIFRYGDATNGWTEL
jgi:hypothetical protein